MAEKIVLPLVVAEARTGRPGSSSVALPGHPQVGMFCDGVVSGGEMAVSFFGPVEALIDAGVATAAMLASSQPGRARRDANGCRFTLQRNFRMGSGGTPIAFAKLVFYWPAVLADQRPGVREAIEASRRVLQWYEVRHTGACAKSDPVLRPRPVLRLIIDNTR